MTSLGRPSNLGEQRRPGRPADELRLRRELRRVQAENVELRREVAALRGELADTLALVADLDPDGSRTYAWLLGIG